MRTIMKTATALPVALVGLMGMAGCGDDGGGETGSGSGADEQASVDSIAATADEEAYVDAIAATADEGAFAGTDGRCVAQAIVDAIGVDTLSGAVTPEEISADPNADFEDFGIEITPESGQAMYDGMTGCMDVRQALIDAMAGEQSISPELQECLAGAFDDDALLRDAIVATFTGGSDAIEQDPELSRRFLQAIAPCMQLDAAAG